MRKLLLISALIVLGASANAREEQNLYKWEDEEGNVYYSDKVPPEFAERPKARLNDQGVAVEELEGKKTPEQLEQERMERERQAKLEMQNRQDQALLATYLSVDEIIMHRDRRVELFQAQARVTKLYLRNLRRRLDSLREEAARYQPHNQDRDAAMIPDDLDRDLRDTKATIKRHERNLEKYEADERGIIEDFDNSIERFRRLKGIDGPEPEQTASTGA